jgi:pilus assembly protein CpaF
VQVSRLQDGSRKITHVSEVLAFDPQTGAYQIQDIFEREYLGFSEAGDIESTLRPTGILPRALEQLHEHGLDLPASVHDAARRREQGHA